MTTIKTITEDEALQLIASDVEDLARDFASVASVDREEFLKACGIK